MFDEREMREGQLGEWGVRNMQALTTLLGEGKLGYVFPYSSFSFDADLNVLALSVGKTLLPVRRSRWSGLTRQIPCVVPVVPGASSTAASPSSSQLEAWRGLLLHAKAADCEVSEAIAKVCRRCCKPI